MKIYLLRGKDGDLEFATVKRRVVDIESNPTGKSNQHNILDSREYKVEFLNSETENFTSNTITENLLVQDDQEGYQQLLIDGIVD